MPSAFQWNFFSTNQGQLRPAMGAQALTGTPLKCLATTLMFRNAKIDSSNIVFMQYHPNIQDLILINFVMF